MRCAVRRIVNLCSILFLCAVACAGCKSSDVRPAGSDNTGEANVEGSGQQAPGAVDATGKAPAGPGSAGETVTASSYYKHQVKWNGETVSIIAAWYTGDKLNWETLARHNPSIDPLRIHPGMRILIPENTMRTKKKMTKEFVDGFYHSVKRRGTKKAHDTDISSNDDEIKIFGPKEPTVNLNKHGADEYP